MGVVFGLILFILACVLINRGNLVRAGFPADSKGHVCMYDRNAKDLLVPFVYFEDPSKPMQSR